MNTRLRIPLMDPLIVVLAGGGLGHLIFLMRQNQEEPEGLRQGPKFAMDVLEQQPPLNDSGHEKFIAHATPN